MMHACIPKAFHMCDTRCTLPTKQTLSKVIQDDLHVFYYEKLCCFVGGFVRRFGVGLSNPRYHTYITTNRRHEVKHQK